MADAEKLLALLQNGGIGVLVLALVGILTLIRLLDAVWDIFRKWRRNSSVEEQRRTCEQRFDRDRQRLDKLETGQDVLVYGMAELLGHYLHNGNADEMAKAEQKLKKWLYER